MITKPKLNFEFSKSCILLALITLALFSSCGGPNESEQIDLYTQIALEDLYGKQREELADVFPDTEDQLTNLYNWKEILLDYNDNNQLASISFIPKKPIKEETARLILIRRFGLKLDESKYVAAPAIHAYRDMRGKIRTVNFYPKSTDATEYKVNEVSIFYNLEWDE